jgi:magnesium chelatase subunit I
VPAFDSDNNGPPEIPTEFSEAATISDNELEKTSEFEASQKELRDQIAAARKLLPQVLIDYELRVSISKICSELDVDGLRGDIVTNRASKAIAAFEGRTQVTPKDIFTIVALCLRHRLRKDPLESIDSGDKVQEAFRRVFTDTES